VDIEELTAERKRRETRWGGWKQRVVDIRALAMPGAWGKVFPEADMDMPLVANLFRTTIEDGGRLFAQQQPLERCDPDNGGDAARKRARTRERVMSGYTAGSKLYDYREHIGQDMIASGISGIRVWPDQSQSADRRLPRFDRLQPEAIFPSPSWRSDRETDDVMIVGKESIRECAKRWPEATAALMAKVEMHLAAAYRSGSPMLRPIEFEVIDSYASDLVCRAMAWCTPDGSYEGEMVRQMVNDTGVCPVQLAARKTWSMEPIGQLDDSKGIVRTENRYWRMLVDYFAQMVYSGKLVWNVKDPHIKSPGRPYLALGPDAFMKPVIPEMPNVQAMAIVQELDDAARTSMVAPRSREGDVQLNKASAAFLTRAQGQLTSVTASLQESWAQCKQRANEVAFAQDEKWCNNRKTITSSARGRRFATTYKPSEVIAGDYSNRVTYGASAGLDLPTWNVINIQKHMQGAMSLEQFVESDPTVEDVDAYVSSIYKGRVADSLFAGLSDPAVPLQTRLQAFVMLSDEVPLDKVAKVLLAQPAPAQPQPGMPMPPGPAAPGPGMGPAGLPAGMGQNGPAGQPGQENPLPPLAALMGGAARP
jgi:hypothetical protein